MTISNQNENLAIAFSHRLEPEQRTDNEIDRLFNSIGLMTGRVTAILQTIVDSGNGPLKEQYLTDAALCEVQDISAVINELRKAVKVALDIQCDKN